MDTIGTEPQTKVACALAGAALSLPSLRPPGSLPQQTAVELYEGAWALIDARSGDHWAPACGEPALIHRRPGASHQTRFAPAPDFYWPAVVTTECLADHLLSAGGTTAMLLAQVTLGLALRANSMTVTLDELIRTVGLDPRSARERADLRRWVWQTLNVICSLEIHGARRGSYRDPRTRRELNLTSRDRFLVITGSTWAEPTSAQDEAPLTVTLAVGPWVERVRKASGVLSSLGDVRAIAAIPPNRVSGAWARGIGAALHHHWRVNASRTEVGGSAEQPEVRPPAVSRRLLSQFCQPSPPLPTVTEVLASRNPGRARTYMSAAFDHLRACGLIAAGWCEPAGEWPRWGWQSAWLAERLEVAPGPLCAAQIAAIRRAAQGRRPPRKARATR